MRGGGITDAFAELELVAWQHLSQSRPDQRRADQRRSGPARRLRRTRGGS